MLDHTIHMLTLAKYPTDILEVHVRAHQRETKRLLNNTAAIGQD